MPRVSRKKAREMKWNELAQAFEDEIVRREKLGHAFLEVTPDVSTRFEPGMRTRRRRVAELRREVKKRLKMLEDPQLMLQY